MSNLPAVSTDALLVHVAKAVEELRAEVTRSNAINEVLLERLTDSSHLTLAEIAKVQHISKTSARRRYSRFLEVIPGSRRRGVPRARVLDGWVPVKTERAATKRRAAAKETSKGAA